MKKFVVLLVVVAISCMSAVAFASDVAVSGSIDIRSRDFDNELAMTSDVDNSGTERDTQQRVRLNIDAKAGDVKGRISIENDWDTWGRLERTQGNTANNGTTGALDVREAWINFNLPGIPVNVNVGHQLLQLGNGWFLRNMKYGDDAWVVANVTGANTAAFVDIKAYEGTTGEADDMDGYAFLDVFKLSDTMMVGIDLTNVKDRRAILDSSAGPFPLGSRVGGGVFGNAMTKINLYNIGLNFNGQLGPLNLKFEADKNFGKADLISGATTPDGVPANNPKFKGYQLVLTGGMSMDPATINFTVARGTGLKSDFATNGNLDINQMVTILDNDQHYTLLYEYKVQTAALNVPSYSASTDGLHTGFANTTALNVGAKVAATKSLTIGADLWWLQATEAVAINGATDIAGGDATSKKLGYEIDVAVNWQLADALSWNWQFGYFKPGAAYDSPSTTLPGNGNNESADAVMGAQGVLSFKF